MNTETKRALYRKAGLDPDLADQDERTQRRDLKERLKDRRESARKHERPR